MKKFVWKNSRKSDFEDFFCGVHFYFSGSEEEYHQLVHHYNHLAEMYHLELLMFHKWEADETDVYSYIRANFRKKNQTPPVSPSCLKAVFENDVKILQRTFRLGEVIFFETPEDLDL